MSNSLNDGLLLTLQEPAHPGAVGGRRAERRDAVANRARILEVAQSLFAERGVAQVSMAEIAATAQVGKGTLYRHFAHKGELCRALLDEQFRAHQDAALAMLREMHAARVPYREQIRVFLEHTVAFIDEHLAYLDEVQRAYGMGGPEEDAPIMTWLALTLRGLLSAAVGSGEADADLDIELAVDLLLAPLTALYFRFLRARGYSLARIARGIDGLVEGWF
ncbi:MAG: TetR family transcriptional regulator [Chloroflexi bacterium]|nr:TetR family transcriptional regulator [Chloroflexota bacterium]